MLIFITSLNSCSKSIVGYYSGDFISTQKYMNWTDLKLHDNTTFLLTKTNTILEFEVPQLSIIKINGRYLSENKKLTLIPTHQTNLSIVYTKNTNRERGGSEYIISDTIKSYRTLVNEEVIIMQIEYSNDTIKLQNDKYSFSYPLNSLNH